MSPLINKAITVAMKAHAKQTRKFDNSPYLGHLLEVLSILGYFGMEDEKVLCAALLHDTLEDTVITKIQLKEEFGLDVLTMVELMTDDKSLLLKDRREVQLNKLCDLNADIQAIKLADLISNLSALPPSWPVEKKEQYLAWCAQFIAACNHAPTSMKEMGEYLLSNQSGDSNDFDVMRRWCEQDNLFWSEEVRALLFLSSKDANTVEAHMIDDNADVLNLLFHLGLIRGFEVNWSSHCSFTLVNKTAKAGDFSDLKCFQISVISN